MSNPSSPHSASQFLSFTKMPLMQSAFGSGAHQSLATSGVPSSTSPILTLSTVLTDLHILLKRYKLSSSLNSYQFHSKNTQRHFVYMGKRYRRVTAILRTDGMFGMLLETIQLKEGLLEGDFWDNVLLFFFHSCVQLVKIQTLYR